MAKFCGKCGSQLDETTGKCPNCEKEQAEKKKIVTKKRVISIIVAVSILLGSIGGYLAMTYQPEAVINDYTEDNNGADDNATADESKEEQTAVISSNVKVFIEEDASDINNKIQDVTITNTELYVKMENGTAFDDLGSGDIFFLEGDKTSPLGETYIGKVISVHTDGTSTTYQIETPMVDEVFDVLDIDFSKELKAEDIESIQTIEGVTVKQVDGLEESFMQLTDDMNNQGQMTTLAYRAPASALRTSAAGNGVGDDIVLDINVDLLKVFGLQEEGAVGFDEYEYTEGYRINVCITETGKKYHDENCTCLGFSKETLPLSDAVNEGYEPCFICVPPTLKSEGSKYNADASLMLEGKVGLEDLKYSIDYEWDILNGKGLEQLEAQAEGNFVSGIGLKSKLSLELGGEKTTITLPMNTVKLQGLEEKLFPIAFISYNGVSLNVSSLFPGNDYIQAVTSVVPVTVGFIVYTDVSGNITVDATASFNFNYAFECSYTAVEDGEWVNKWESQGEPSIQTALDFEIAGDFDAHFGCSVSLYVFNLNVAEVAVAKAGFEGEGNLKIEHATEYKKLSEDWEKTAESKTSGSLYGRLYFKLFETNIKLKTRIKVWKAVDFSNTIDYTSVWWDKTIAEWGKRNETRYNEDLMSYSAITAKDTDAIYYKDTNNMLIKEQDGYKSILYDGEFFSICGIDTSYLYLMIVADDEYEIRRVSKDGNANKVVADDVANILTMDEQYIYYISAFDSTSIMRLDRQSLKEEQFADFEDDVTFMEVQEGGFYVVTKESGMFASLFGSATKYYLLNNSGGVLISYGESPEISQYYLIEHDSYYRASKITANGYLRNSAAEVYWLSKDKTASVLTETVAGWKSNDAGIFTVLEDGNGAYQIVLYRALDGQRIHVTDASSNQAFFTLCQGDSGEWYYFDQTSSELILYVLTEDFYSKEVVKRFALGEISCNLENCSMIIMDNRIYFYTMPDDSTSKVLYRYDLISGGGNN